MPGHLSGLTGGPTMRNADLEAQAQSNDLADFGFGFDKKFEATIIGRMDINDEILRRLMDDATFAEAVRSYYRQHVYARLREGD